MNLEVGVTIDASADAVWRTVEPIERHVEWMHDAESIAFTTQEHRGVGAAFDCATRIGPFRTVDRMTVTEWEPAQVMGIEHRGVVTGRGRFTLTSLGADRTQFTWSEELRFPWWMGGPVGATAARPALRAIWNRNLRALKGLVEASTR